MRYSCLDCHGGDEEYAHFHFDEIGEEFDSSIHAKSFGTQFKCESCHNPHSYQLKFRKEFDIEKIIKNNNSVCLNCHTNDIEYNLFVNNKRPDILSTHDWLPNQELHFNKVQMFFRRPTQHYQYQ